MKSPSLHHHCTRRTFLSLAAKSSIGLVLAERVLADPYAPVFAPPVSALPRRITGRVSVGGVPTKGAVVSDGVSAVACDVDGRFLIHSTSVQNHVFCSLPPHALIPRQQSGTSHIYRSIPEGVGEEHAVSFDFDLAANATTRHNVVVLADPQTLDAADVNRFISETAPDVRATVASLESETFAVGCGDLMFDRLEFFPDYERAIREMGIPGFQVVGNHDVDVTTKSDAASDKLFRARFGPNYYSFNRGEIHYVVLDDILWFGSGYIGYVDDVQLEWLRQDLMFVEKGRPVVVFVHIPVFCFQHERMGLKRASNSEVMTNREALYRLLEGYDARIIAGHMHESERLRDGGIPQHVAGAVCGGWWTGDICGDGTPNGYAVYEVSGTGVRSYYKPTGKEREHQLTVHAVGADASLPGHIIANVWDADPSWNVVWYEDGVKKGKLNMRRGKDPQAAALLDGEGRPKRHAWVDAYVTDHLFVAKVEQHPSRIVVEASDGNGNVFTASPTERS